MIARYCDSRIPSGVIPEDKLLLAKRTGVDTDETTIAGFIEHARDQFLLHFESLAFSRALETAWSVVARVDKMITDAKPWDLAKDENQKQTLGVVLYRAAEVASLVERAAVSGDAGSEPRDVDAVGAGRLARAGRSADLKWGELKEGGAIRRRAAGLSPHRQGKNDG